MGNKNSGKRKYYINKYFFKTWSSEMAYILGFTCADGNVYRGTLAWDLTNKHLSNLKLLQDFNTAMESNYPIDKRKKSYRLRISENCLLEDIKKLGIIPNKKKILDFPNVPKKYLPHFIRGFLEGDGWIVTRIRENGGKEICVGFSNGSLKFMTGLVKSLKNMGLKKFNLRKRNKLMKNGKLAIYYQMEFYSNNAHQILTYIYESLKENDICLDRKYKKFIEAKKLFLEQTEINKFGRTSIQIQEQYGNPTETIIKTFLIKEHLIPREIAKQLNVSISTIYRWMDKMNIRKPTKRGSKEWQDRVINGKKLVQYEYY